VSLHASLGGGQVITKPLIFEGERLLVNFSTSAAGSLRVELLGGNGVPVKGYALSDCGEIYGDEIERVVKWKGQNMGGMAGRPVRLRFVLKDADLFAFASQSAP